MRLLTSTGACLSASCKCALASVHDLALQWGCSHQRLRARRLDQLPKTTEHVVCVHTVPLVFPSLPLSEGLMTVIEGLPILKAGMTKTGLGAGIIDKFAPRFSLMLRMRACFEHDTQADVGGEQDELLSHPKGAQHV